MEMQATDLRDTPPHSQEGMIRTRQVAYHPTKVHQINQVAYHPLEHLPSNLTDVYSEERYGSVPPRIGYSRQSVAMQRFPLECNGHSQGYPREAVSDGQVLVPPTREYGSRLHHLEMHPVQSSNCPTASITPVQKSKNITQVNGWNPASPSTLPRSSDNDNVNNAAKSKTAEPLPSPANRISLLDKTKLPKKSPVATVLPQVQAKPKNALDAEIKDRPHDPSRIFNFDLTTSPQHAQPCNDHNKMESSVKTEEKPQSQAKKTDERKTKKKGRSNKFSKEPARNYSTRARTRSGVTSEDYNNWSDDRSLDKYSTASVNPHKPKTTIPMGLKRKVFSGVSQKSKKIRSEDIVCGSKETCDVLANRKRSGCLANTSESIEVA
ncbi:uncharacterized protein LOC114575561 [Exaiptasia diaphana]|uniref:Uncharacterized protein n=1 Tax=Exaiptasia diaphana TaxID=2652724 RepID=A0A913YN48_EXADI|nr:uncharacterized protein LOC114575561 [Exaiptasia diaphana]